MNDNKVLPYLDASALWRKLGVDASFAELRRLAGLSPDHFDAMYLPALVEFSERVQLAPASMSHHHAYAGGLLLHTLDVVRHALTLRKAFHLPIGAEPEITARLEHLYTYAVFAVGLLHDAGKAMVNVRFIDPARADRTWSPLGSTFRECGFKKYRLDFIYPVPYSLHQQVAASVFYWLPDIARSWLGQEPILLGELLAALYGDYLDAGVFAEILQKADGHSVATDMQLDTRDYQRFQTPLIPIQVRIKNALRQVFESNTLRLNAAGAQGWVDNTGEFMYLVCRPTAGAIVEQARSEGVTSLPTEPGRLYDVLADYGLVELTDEGKAIWRVRLVLDDFDHTLTCLKFPVRSYFMPSRLPSPWSGEITIVGVDDNQGTEAATNQDMDAGAVSDDVSTGATNSIEDPMAGAVFDVDDGFDSELDNALFGSPTQKQQTKTAKKTLIGAKTKPEQSAGATPNSAASVSDNLTVDTGDKKRTGQLFLNWIKQGVADGDLKVNKTDAAVHAVPEGALLVSPQIYKKFCQRFTIINHTDSKPNFWAVQKGLESLKIHKRTPAHLNVWTYNVVNKTGNSVAKLQGYVLPKEAVFGSQFPDDNKFLQKQSHSPTSTS